MLGHLKRYEAAVMLGLAAAGAVAGLWQWRRIRRRRERATLKTGAGQSPSE